MKSIENYGIVEVNNDKLLTGIETGDKIIMNQLSIIEIAEEHYNDKLF